MTLDGGSAAKIVFSEFAQVSLLVACRIPEAVFNIMLQYLQHGTG